MKKFIFSAVALTAFVLPGFANDIAEKSSVVAVEENCSETYSQEVACLKRENKELSDSEARKQARPVYYECQQRNYNERQQEKIKAFEKL